MTQEENHLLADIMIGGNHLASALVHNLGPDFSERFPPTANAQAVYNTLNAELKLGKGSIVYDAWVCWAAIMRARPAVARSELVSTDMSRDPWVQADA